MVADALWLVPLTDFEPKDRQDPVELQEQEGLLGNGGAKSRSEWARD